MGIELPVELADVAARAGVAWPEADEDGMRASATAWREAGNRISRLAAESDGSAGEVLASFTGEAGDAARRNWNAVVAPDGDLAEAVRGCAAAADRLEHAADRIGAAKVGIVRELVDLAKNADAAGTAAAAGHPTALLGLDTAVRGAAATVADLTGTLAGAVRLDSGVDVAAARPPVDADPGAHGGGLLPGLLDPVLTTATNTADAVAPVVTGAVHTVVPVVGVVGEVVETVVETAAGTVAPVVGTVGGVVDEVVRTASDTVVDTAAPVVDTVAPVVAPVVGTTGEVVQHTVDAVVAPVVEPVVESVVEPAAGTAGQVVPGVAGPALDAGHDAVTPLTGVPVQTPASPLPPPADQGFAGPPRHEGATNQSLVSGVRPADLPAAPVQAPAQPPVVPPSAVPPAAPPAPAPGLPQTGVPLAGAASGGPAAGGVAQHQGPQQRSVEPQRTPESQRSERAQPGAPAQQQSAGKGDARSKAADAAAAAAVVVVGMRTQPDADHRGPQRTGQASSVLAAPVSAAAPEPSTTQPVRPAAPLTGEVALFLVHLFPIGRMPVPSHRPARQLPPPREEFDFAAGLRFAPLDHPRADLVAAPVRPRDPVVPGEGLPAHHPVVLALTEGYDPQAGEHERDWDRRFLVRAEPPEYAWPPGELFPEGGYDEGEPEVVAPGAELDRFGTPEGRVLSEAGTPFGLRALPPAALDSGYRRYRVLRPLPVWRTLSAAWFGQAGGGVRYRTTHPVAELVALGHLADVTGTANAIDREQRP
ncbi:TNT domain-containing protein [Umezawaea beigongshangensis]|uniref:TNT domain-containing protein n=1 Tax=Umezawaea beigongshangensis TaxID=2780383 RepID=UPI001E5F7B5E|nr:TNT domain-containing protein [Umezawaea beigongshangensis]